MEPIEFKEANITLAKEQSEYRPLPVYIEQSDPQGQVISCWALSWRERFKLLFNGKLFLTQLTFHQPLQPQLPRVDTPFIQNKKISIKEKLINIYQH